MTTAVGRWSHECSHSSSCGISTPYTVRNEFICFAYSFDQDVIP